VSLSGTTYLAGSALTMPEAIGQAVRCTGLPLDEVLPMATTNPAAYLGIAPEGTVSGEWDPAGCQFRITGVE
jgi:N-acetylglucosamine-6-phosphate deacetylase